MLNIENTATSLRALMVQHRDYTTIQIVPAHLRMEVDINEVPAEVAAAILDHSPSTLTAEIGMFSRKGKEYLSFSAGKGSTDGFPSVSLAL